jgi:hypothetical protein
VRFLFTPSLLIGGILLIVYCQFAAHFAKRLAPHLTAQVESICPVEARRAVTNFWVGSEAKNIANLPQLLTWIFFPLTYPLLAIISGDALAGLAFLVVAESYIYSLTYAFLFVRVSGFAIGNIFFLIRQTSTLKPYTEDSSLGLKPFAIYAFYITVMLEFLVILLILLVPPIPKIPTLNAFPTIITSVQAATLALIIFLQIAAYSADFFHPLFLLHGKIAPVKTERLRWVNQWYTNVIEQIEQGIGHSLSEEKIRELEAIEKIRTEIRGIHGWAVSFDFVGPLMSAIVGGVVVGIILSLIRGY